MKVLIFGGNGFIGAETVEQLLESGVTDVTLVNRGLSWDWDTTTTVKPRVNCLHADRDKPLHEYPKLCKFVKKARPDVTVDFSGYSALAVREAVELVTGYTNLYIYISSDSVYEVCRDKLHEGPSRETDAVRPEDEQERKTASRRDSYGDDKLSGEEAIIEHHKQNPKSLSYVILRLADVLGPRDCTNRFWQYQLWVEMATKHRKYSVVIPRKYDGAPLTFVYSKDVAKMITRIVHMDDKSRQGIVNEGYNLSCSENKDLREFLQVAQMYVSPMSKSLDILSEDSDEVPQIYPSVDKGPIDISKATAKLGWSPTPLDGVIKSTVEYFRSVVSQQLFLKERKEVYRDLKESLEDMFDKQTLKRDLKEMLLLI